MLESILLWYNLIFYIPLLVSVLLSISVALGAVDPGGVDVDSDYDIDGDSHNFLSVLGIGKVPLIIVLITLGLIFGGVGLAVNYFLAPLIKFTSIFAFASVVLALGISFFTTGYIARIVAKFIPTTETKSVTSGDLIGSSGALILPCDTLIVGLAQIIKDGDLYQISCYSSGGALEKGTKILVTEYDKVTGWYCVCKDPLAEERN